MTPTRRHTACTIIYTNRVKRVEEKNSVALTSAGLQNEPLWVGQTSKAQPNPQKPSSGTMLQKTKKLRGERKQAAVKGSKGKGKQGSEAKGRIYHRKSGTLNGIPGGN